MPLGGLTILKTVICCVTWLELFSPESVISIINLENNNGLLKKCSRADFNFARLVKILHGTVGHFNHILNL